MNEKRFTIEKIFKEYPKLRDNETECFYHLVDNERNAEIFCERLNNLVEENEQLKEELQRFKKYVFSQDNILCYKCEHCIKKDIYVVDCEMKGKVDVHGLCSLFREVKV